ncbi:hypothetical protein HanPSC8_Chr14g0622391 [Helianthus annuus]|nr:hypothetical protein HanPSC8_Chr14g0622391 [Helianthus annuus]
MEPTWLGQITVQPSLIPSLELQASATKPAPARYPSTVVSEGFSQLCEASLTQCPLL